MWGYIVTSRNFPRCRVSIRSSSVGVTYDVHLGVCVILIIEDLTVTEMKNSNTMMFHLLDLDPQPLYKLMYF
jgi:hypothetical protein